MVDEFVAETTTGGRPRTDGMPAMNRATLLIGVAFLVAAASAACASGNSAPDLSSAPVARQIVAATGHASTVSTWYSSPLEATPLTTYVIDGEEKPNPCFGPLCRWNGTQCDWRNGVLLARWSTSSRRTTNRGTHAIQP